MSASIRFYSEGIPFHLKNVRRIRAWLEDAVLREKHESGEITVIFCSDDYLHRMNVEHLGHDTLTDIITFDYSQGRLVSGDLFISIDRVRENARELNQRPEDELHRVMVHGVLHLCGYKDKSLKDSKLMRSKEDFYLSLRPF